MKINQIFLKNQKGFLSLHLFLPLIIAVIAIAGVGSYVINQSKAETGPLDKAGCEIRGRIWYEKNANKKYCTQTCAPFTGNLITGTYYSYCSNTLTASSIMTQYICNDLGRVWLQDGCARRADQVTKSGVPQCSSSAATYFVNNTNDSCGIVYKLPTSAPQPSYLEPQPEALKIGANPVVTPIPDEIWTNMVSWQEGCPVGRSALLYMQVNYWGFDGRRHRGSLIFSAIHKNQFIKAFTSIYENRIPLSGMYLPDKFGYSSLVNGADDYASMQHNNTSAFNCRWVVGRPGVISPHSFGTSVDINPFLNPYKSAQGWVPNEWWANQYIPPYTWRNSGDLMVKIMQEAGFTWTYTTNDSQHFDVN